MATKQSTSPTGTSPPTTAAGGLSPAAQAAIAKAFPGGIPTLAPADKKQTSQSSPIGKVPYQATGANGELLYNADGTPVRWQAVRPEPIVSRIGGEAAGRIGAVGVTPKYYAGDDAALLVGLPPEVLADLQFRMTKIGLYGSKKPNITYGIPDADTINAFSQVLGAANASGYTYQEILSLWGSQGVQAMQPEAPKPTHTISTTNTADLVAVFKKAARDAIGKEVDDETATRWAHTFQGSEAAYQSSAYAVQDAAAGGNTTMQSPMDPTTFADQQLKQNNPDEYGATRAINQLDTFRKILSGPFAGGQ